MSRYRHAIIGCHLLAMATTLSSFSLLFADDKLDTNKAVPRDPGEISREATALVRLASKKVDEAQRVKAIVGLCKLFVEVGEHPDIDKSATLQRVSVETQTRLRGIEERITTELRRQQIPEPQSMIDAERTKRKSLATNSNPAGTGSPAPTDTPTNDSSEDNTDSHDASPSEKNAGGNTASKPASNHHGLGGPGGVDDIGWWLVDLIRHTIEPDYWDTAGGPGTVVYYGPSRALVIRGSWRIHEKVADLLSAIR